MHPGDLNEKEIQKGWNRCICMADSFCYTVETNITCKGTPIKINFKRNMYQKLWTKENTDNYLKSIKGTIHIEDKIIINIYISRL